MRWAGPARDRLYSFQAWDGRLQLAKLLIAKEKGRSRHHHSCAPYGRSIGAGGLTGRMDYAAPRLSFRDLQKILMGQTPVLIRNGVAALNVTNLTTTNLGRGLTEPAVVHDHQAVPRACTQHPRRSMSRWSKGFFAVIAGSLAFGAAHLEMASGSNLKVPVRGDAGLFGSRGVTAQPLLAEEVNRAGKSDRLASAVAGASGPTIVFRLSGLKNTSIATFLPLPQRAQAPASKSVLGTAACEPPVSVLTEVARVIENGRCVT
jgi:hypothetical protein